MPQNAEWRLFLPNKGDGDNLSEAEQTLVALVDDVRPRDRTDVYTKAGDDIGIKRRVSGKIAGAPLVLSSRFLRGCSATGVLIWYEVLLVHCWLVRST